MNLVAFRTIQIDGLSIFYREAGAKNAETLLLLHGLPSSSRMAGTSHWTRLPMRLLIL
jgi:pimeloyl-ACP methyl ester carboxylesterase